MSVAGDKSSQFTGEKYICIETYRKTGDPVRTPVWFVEENGELFVRTDSDTGKIKRIRNNPKVRVATCNARGTPNGSWIDGNARMLDDRSVPDSLARRSGRENRLLSALISILKHSHFSV